MKNILLTLLMLSSGVLLNAMGKKEKIDERSNTRREEMRTKLNQVRMQALANRKKDQPNDLSNQTDQTEHKENCMRQIWQWNPSDKE